jgi:hypothetical protein
MRDVFQGPPSMASVELAGAARYLARALDVGRAMDTSAVRAIAQWAADEPGELAPAAYAVADDERALDLLTRAAFEFCEE